MCEFVLVFQRYASTIYFSLILSLSEVDGNADERRNGGWNEPAQVDGLAWGGVQ